MGGQYGTVNTEALLNLMRVVLVDVVNKVAKEGWKPEDLGAPLEDPAFEAAAAAVLAGAGQLVAEVTELDVFDGFHLARTAYSVMDEVLAALRQLKK